MSVISIGPAGEKLVRFAAIVGDYGHVAAHNGVGAVMGSKRLKAIAVRRENIPIRVNDRQRLSAVAEQVYKKVTNAPLGVHTHGTLGPKGRGPGRLIAATLPVKNYTTNFFPPGALLEADNFRSRAEVKWQPCWACKFHHCHVYKIKDGPYAGYEVEEPEYEQVASFGAVIGQGDIDAQIVLSNEADRLGMDCNESGWLLSWLMECYEKGILTSKDIDGIELKWGSVEATRTLLKKIALRDGIGDVLAEGVMRASQKIAAQASNLALFTKKGNTPRTHDHRSIWPVLLDTCTSDVGTDEDAMFGIKPSEFGLPVNSDVFSPEIVPLMLARASGRMPFIDSLGVCRYNVPVTVIPEIAELVSAVSGWDYTPEEVITTGRRLANLARVFNIRHGLKAELDWPSPRYASAPLDGPFQGKTALPYWDQMLKSYYQNMGWDTTSGKPLPETLRSLGLEHVTKDIWQ